VLGLVQERRAEEALAALKRLAAPDAQVLRDGRRQSIPGRDLVPGVVRVSTGYAGNGTCQNTRLVAGVLAMEAR
jgi:Ca2+-transporting ATPase